MASESKRLLICLSSSLITETQVHYVKAHSYRVKPLQKEGHLAVDGEAMPFEEFQVEVIRGGATLMSLYGHYVAKFEPRSPLKPAAKSV